MFETIKPRIFAWSTILSGTLFTLIGSNSWWICLKSILAFFCVQVQFVVCWLFLNRRGSGLGVGEGIHCRMISKIVVSSTNFHILMLLTCRSFTNRRNSQGPNVVPWDTPERRVSMMKGRRQASLFGICRTKSQLSRSTTFGVMSGFEVFFIRMEWSTWSKACGARFVCTRLFLFNQMRQGIPTGGKLICSLRPFTKHWRGHWYRPVLVWI
jgi:hypothetical protein